MAKKLFNELEAVSSHYISDFLFDEEASIPKGQRLGIGSLMVVLSCVLGVQDASAWHSSHNNWDYPRHSSHSSHASHSHPLFRWSFQLIYIASTLRAYELT